MASHNSDHLGLLGTGRRLPPGGCLCTAIGIGTPMHLHLFGGHLLTDLGPILGVLALFAGATFWLFRRYGGSRQPEVAADSHRIWAEFEACGCDPSCDPAENEPTEDDEPVERQPVRA